MTDDAGPTPVGGWAGTAAARRVGYVLLFIGVLARLLVPWFGAVTADGSAYYAIAHEVAAGHGPVAPWGPVTEPGPAAPEWTGHYPPLYPAYLAAWFAVAGTSPGVALWASAALGLAAVLVAYLCARWVLGAGPAVLAAGLVAAQPRLEWSALAGFSEALTLILGTLLGAFLVKSVRRPAWLVGAGASAGALYLVRASVGPLGLLAIMAGVAWRVRFHGWRRGLFEPWFVAGGVAFAAVAGPWAVLGAMHGGTSFDARPFLWALATPGRLAFALAVKAVWFAALAGCYAAPFWPELRSAVRAGGEESSVPLVGLVACAATGCVAAAVFWLVEGSPPFWLDNERYLVVAYPFVTWLFLRGAAGAGIWLRLHGTALATVGVGAFVVLSSAGSPVAGLASGLHGVPEGARLGLAGPVARYEAYPYVGAANVSVAFCDYGPGTCAGWATWALARGVPLPPGFVEAATSCVERPFAKPDCAVLGRWAPPVNATG